ncbi:zinc finger-like domain-containing protein [Vibrio casei]|uniref:Antitermination protein n=1 Tax=Vibrio casei TaxID=673372 RepID=A0A368LHJ2_9VIBR|nr:zinc finger-like domain-containing protein [Vibrio casei]RCS70158.1 hypothetical protein CIK83_11880 [Vibrio casei]SJN24341.1 hypothetical protein FM109_05410 [Vibrio casei]
MSYLERLGMAGVKTVKFDTGRGGLTELTGLDVVAALSGLDDVCCHYAHAFLTNGTSRRSVDRVVNYLSRMTEAVKPEQAKGLAVVALNENSQPQCVACGGTGIQHNYSDSLSMMIEALPCPHCKGLGRKPMKIKDKAKLIGVSWDTYNRKRDLYENELSAMKSEIANIEQRINKHGKEKLG